MAWRGCAWDAGYTVEPSGDVVGFNQRNVDEAGCPPDDPNDIPYPSFHHSTPTAAVKRFLLTKGIETSSSISFTTKNPSIKWSPFSSV